jgi:chromosome partitioning protein
VIVIANQKGGVGKTTTAVTLAAGFAELGKRVLLIDCDSQGNVAHFLGLARGGDLYDLVVMQRMLLEVAVDVPDVPNLRVVRSDESTVDIEKMLLAGASRIKTETALSKPLNGVTGRHFDLVIIDTAPALSAVQVSALRAADWLIIPVIPEYASEAGVSQLSATVNLLRSQGSHVSLLGVLPVMVNGRSNEHAQTIRDLEAAFPGLVLPRVRRLIALGEAPRAGKSIWHYAPTSEAAQDYAEVLAEVNIRV